MRTLKLSIAYLFYVIGVLKIIDWFIFCNQNGNFKNLRFADLKLKYVERFPEFIKPLYTTTPELAAIISAILFTIAGLVFLNMKSSAYMVLAISAFIFACWNLLSIM